MDPAQSERSALPVAGPSVFALGFVLVFLATSPGCETRRDEAPEAPVAAPSDAVASAARPPGAPAEPAPDPLTGLDSAYSSAESLSRAVLKALEERDETELNRLRVDHREYSELLFPHFDAARPPRNIPVELHWKLLDTKSINGVRDALGAYGGQEFELLEVLPQGVEEFPTFKLLRRVKLKLRRVSDGEVATVTIFGSIVEMDGKFKLLSYPS